MGRSKYRFKDRGGYERALQEAEMQLTLHRVTLDALLREEFAWTRRFCSGGSWFQMGLARAHKPSGGVTLMREFYPTNGKPSQTARWTDGWVREMSEYYASYLPADDEARAYRDCFYALRELYHEATRPERTTA